MAAAIDIGPMHSRGHSSRGLGPQTIRHLGLIAGCGTAFRVLYHTGFKPCWSGDSYVYSNMYLLWSRHFFSTSYRPPLYALFLGVVQFFTGTPLIPSRMGAASMYSVVYLQSVMGILSALVLYGALRLADVRPRIAVGGGIAFSLIGTICVTELLILTETLSLLLITTGCCLFLHAMRGLRGKSSFRGSALASGLFFSLAILTRPENLVFFAMLVTLVFLSAIRAYSLESLRWASGSLARMGLLLVASGVPLVLLWMTFTLLNIGQFRLAIVTGVTRTEAVYNLFDRADPEDRAAGELLVQSYRYTNHDGTTYRHHVWFALPELERAAHAGLLPISMHEHLPNSPFLLGTRHWLARTFGLQEHIVANGQVIYQPVDLYDYLGALSSKLERRYPGAYLRNVLANFFTDTFTYRFSPPSPKETENPQAPEGGTAVRCLAIYNIAVWIDRLEAPILTIAYVILLGFVAAYPWIFFRKNEQELLGGAPVVMFAVSTFTVIAASCVVAAYYPEHGIAFYGVFVLCVCYALENFVPIKGRIPAAVGSEKNSALMP